MRSSTANGFPILAGGKTRREKEVDTCRFRMVQVALTKCHSQNKTLWTTGEQIVYYSYTCTPAISIEKGRMPLNEQWLRPGTLHQPILKEGKHLLSLPKNAWWNTSLIPLTGDHIPQLFKVFDSSRRFLPSFSAVDSSSSHSIFSCLPCRWLAIYCC